MSESKFKTMRHIETVRNYMNYIIRLLTYRQERHDQTKLKYPEVEIFEEYTPKLRGISFGSEKYKKYMKEMKIGINHHNKNNRHHPEHFENGIQGMNLIDLIEMLCDWKASGLRHDDGSLMKSIDICQDRFKYSDELRQILENTALLFNDENNDIFHKANES